MNTFRGLSKHFDQGEGRKKVEEWIKQRREIPESYGCSLLEVNVHDISILQEPPTYCYRAVWTTTHEEALFRMQGVLSSGGLPPYNPEMEGINLRRLRFTYQHAGIVGFNGELFQQQEMKLHDLHFQFPKESSRLKINPFQPPEFDGQPELVAKARLFTMGKDASYGVPAEIGPLVDPEGVMQKICEGGKVQFTEDNVVLYKRLVSEEGHGKRLYNDVAPGAFSAGDIVEVQFTVLGVPSKMPFEHRKRVDFFLVLRSLTLLDDSLSLACNRKEKAAAKQELDLLPRRMIKRRVGYDRKDDDVATFHKKQFQRKEEVGEGKEEEENSDVNSLLTAMAAMVVDRAGENLEECMKDVIETK